MAPGTRRANRSGYVEHDDFEGLPVRQWRQEWVNVTPAAQQEQQQQNDIWAIELFHGMPKDANLLPPHTQELLRAARSGRLYKRPLPVEDEEAEAEAALPEKQEKKEEETTLQGYQIKLWKQLPKNVEAPVISHLAKRRKNTVTIASRTVEDKIQGPVVTRATVRRIDAAGNPYTEEVTLLEDQLVDGEVISTRVETVSTAKAEALPPPPPPPRRRPPPPKRKSKAGPGRGKKKSKQPLPGEGQPTGIAPARTGFVNPLKTESENENNDPQAGNETPNQDSEIVDGDDDDDEDDDDEGEDGEEGNEGEGDETGDNEQSNDAAGADGKNGEEQISDAVFVSGRSDVDMRDAEILQDPLPPGSLTLAPPSENFASAQPRPEGSPLKNVVLPSPTEPSAYVDSREQAEPAQHTPADVADSAASEPPTPIVGEAPLEAIDRDVEQPEEALLPPPPHDQVGNISSPSVDDGHLKLSNHEAKSQTSQQLEDISQKHIIADQVSAITENSLQLVDFVSVTTPLTVSGWVSEAETASVDEVKEAAPICVEPAAAEPQPIISSKDVTSPVAEDGPDLLGGLMDGLDRQATQSEQNTAPEAPAPASIDEPPSVPSEPAINHEPFREQQPFFEPTSTVEQAPEVQGRHTELPLAVASAEEQHAEDEKKEDLPANA